MREEREGKGRGVQRVMRYATLLGTLKTSHEPKVALKRFLICEGAAEQEAGWEGGGGSLVRGLAGAINIYAWGVFLAGRLSNM